MLEPEASEASGRNAIMIILGSVDIKRLLLELAQLESVEMILNHVTGTLADSRETALVRIWLKEAGDACGTCADRPQCPDQRQCLHLRASAGRSLSGRRQWNSTVRSAFGRFPLGVRKVGQIAASGRAIEVSDLSGEEPWVADPAWIKREQVAGFAGQPLIYKGEILGVLAVFVRRRFGAGTLDLLRMVADHLASAIANSRSFEAIRRLKEKIEAENALLRSEIDEARQFKGLIGNSPPMEEIRRLIRMVGPTEANVLIEGASGTGKEIIAWEIHRHSGRRGGPMIKINCAAIPRELFESEFFGHVKGSFTGAVRDRVGHFQAADQGTLFLDEVGEIPMELQGKLLRVIQEGEYRKVGEDRARQVDTRIIAATNKNLREAVAAGLFREDLYYRLNVFPIAAPDLKDRRADVPLLAEHFLSLAGRRLNRPPMLLSSQQMEYLINYDWPGNVRELQNVIERLVIIGRLDQTLINPHPFSRPSSTPPNDSSSGQARVMTQAELDELERNNLKAALRQTNHRVHGPRGAAKLLGVNPSTLVSRMKKMNLC